MKRLSIYLNFSVLLFGFLSSGICIAETTRVMDPKVNPSINSPGMNGKKNTLKNFEIKKATLTSKIGNSTLVLSIFDQLNAGAISSVKLNDVELLSQYDKGRMIQSTVSFWGGLKGCYNLNEAGSFYDFPQEEGTSVLLSFARNEHFFKTTSQMSYWLSSKDPQCLNVRTEKNSELLSKHTVEKTVSFSPNLYSHLILFNVSFKLAEEDIPLKDPKFNNEVSFEAVAGYLVPTLNQFYVLEPVSGELLKESTPIKGEQDKPVIISNESGTQAVGLFAPELPINKKGYGRDSYLTLKEASTSKWSCNFKLLSNFRPGKYNFQCYVAVGTKEQVKKAIRFLYSTFKMTNQTGLASKDGEVGSNKNIPKKLKEGVQKSKDRMTVVQKKSNGNKGETSVKKEIPPPPQENKIIIDDLSYRKPATKIEIEDNTALPSTTTPTEEDSDKMRILLKPSSTKK